MVQICASFWRTYKRYCASGQNDPARWGSFSDGDTLLDYLFALFRDHNLVLELANPEVGPVGVEGDDALENVTGTRAMSTNRGKRKRDAAELAFQSLVESSASMAASAAKHTRCAEMVSLSATLKNLRECQAAPALIAIVEKQLEDALSPRATTRAVSTGDKTSGLREGQQPEIAERGGLAVDGECGTSGAPWRVSVSAREGISVDDEEGGDESFE